MIMNFNRKASRTFFIVAVFLSVLLCRMDQASAGENQKLVLVLKSSAQVQSAFVTVGDLVVVSSDPRGLAPLLSKIFFGLAPLAGKERVIQKKQLLEWLKTAGIHENLFEIRGASRVKVSSQKKETRLNVKKEAKKNRIQPSRLDSYWRAEC